MLHLQKTSAGSIRQDISRGPGGKPTEGAPSPGRTATWGNMRALMRSVLPLLCAALLACPGREPECRVGADCASGACLADGTCAPLVQDAGGSSDGGDAGEPVQRDGGFDGGTDAGADGGIDGGLGCSPDGDGLITRREMPIAAGLRATYRVATDVSGLDTAGTALPDGGREWSFAGALPNDRSVLVEAMPLQGKWFEAKFPSATYAARLSEKDDLLGVFQATPDALFLLGVVSPSSGAFRTELTYDPPAKILSFPISASATWQSTSTVTGLATGVYAAYTEKYESHVDRTGEVVTPFSRFGVQRVRVTLTRTVGFSVTVTRSLLFAAECFGTVATVVSRPNESQAEFSAASEVRRLAP